MAQPTGPQEAPPPPPEPPPPLRPAAVRDITREIFRLLQPGQATSASSDLRTMSSSKTVPQGVQAYS